MADADSHWQSRPEAGNRLALRLAAWIAGNLNRSILRCLLVPVTLYFYFVRAPERRASRAYLLSVLGRPVRERDVLRHFLSFARVTADRFYFLAGRVDAIDVRFVGTEDTERLVAAGRAGLFLAAHFGSFEASRVIGPRLGGISLRIVLDKSVNALFIDLLKDVNPKMIGRIIDSEQDKAPLGVAIAAAFKDGDWIGFLADRHRPGDRTAWCRFLGRPAAFPIGPYMIASAFAAPIVCAFCRLTATGYEVHCEILSEGRRLPRADRAAALQALAQRYATMLERHVRATPFGWFNFFDFWARARD